MACLCISAKPHRESPAMSMFATVPMAFRRWSTRKGTVKDRLLSCRRHPLKHSVNTTVRGTQCPPCQPVSDPPLFKVVRLLLLFLLFLFSICSSYSSFVSCLSMVWLNVDGCRNYGAGKWLSTKCYGCFFYYTTYIASIFNRMKWKWRFVQGYTTKNILHCSFITASYRPKW